MFCKPQTAWARFPLPSQRLRPALRWSAVAPAPCRYCIGIRAHDKAYRVRSARHAMASTFPRCDWHWRFLCAKCGNARSFHAIAFCPRTKHLFCLDCAPEYRTAHKPFWGWAYHYRMHCPWGSEGHAALDRLEFDGRHPWQLDSSWKRAKHGMSPRADFGDRWSFRVEPLEAITEETSRASWDAAAGWWTSRYSARGDVNREWVIDPALFRLLGDVRGRRILDAGCGSGYLARLLAQRGAHVVGVDHSAKLLEVARREEEAKSLGLEFREADLAHLPFLGEGTFDLVVSNVVLQDVVAFDGVFRELYRVLRPGGRLLFSVTHPCFERPVPGTWLRDPLDSERIEEWRGLLLDRYFDRVALWSAPSARAAPMVGFHRTLEDYATASYSAGFLIRRMVEPTPSPEAVERKYREFADYQRVPLFLIVEAIRPAT